MKKDGFEHNKEGTLYVVATPIGNLEDMTYRAVKVLSRTDLIAAEDTRHTQKLLTHFGIKKRCISCNEHNEEARAEELLKLLRSGKNIALVSDAGTPLVSDPGFKVVRRVLRDNISVVPVPGCNAAMAGLSVSGLPSDSFLFKGFLPRKQGKRKTIIADLLNEKSTLIFYESPRRIKTSIKEMLEILGNRPAMLAREITKLHEEYIRGDLEQILNNLGARDHIRGECTLYIQGSDVKLPVDDDDLDRAIRLELDSPGLHDQGTSDIAKRLSIRFSVSRKKVYDRVLRLKKQSG